MSKPAPFSRLHSQDPDTDRLIQDLYDKLQQIQAMVADLVAKVAALTPTP